MEEKEENEEEETEAVELQACWPVERLGEFGGVISCRRDGLELLVGVAWETAVGGGCTEPGMIESIPGKEPDESKLVGVTE